MIFTESSLSLLSTEELMTLLELIENQLGTERDDFVYNDLLHTWLTILYVANNKLGATEFC